MNLALCYENVVPARGGCETYIADLSRRLVADGHAVHLYACRWDAEALPKGIHVHPLKSPVGPRFLRPWRFSAACQEALRANRHLVSIGFDKIWGQDVLYPQGGLHAASADHNIAKYRQRRIRIAARAIKKLDLAHWSFARLERKQYLGDGRPLIVVNSHMVARHFQQYYNIGLDRLRVVHSAVDPGRFAYADRPKLRQEWRRRWEIASDETVGLFVAMNYRLKGLEPLLRAVACLPAGQRFRLLVAGHPRFEAYSRLADKLGISGRVLFLGPQRDVHHCYFAADFLVHPTFYDPCSLVVLEALACSLPVITTRFNGASELLHPPPSPLPLSPGGRRRGEGAREGFVLDDPHNSRELVWSILQLCEPGRRAACAEAARDAAASWTFEHHYQRLLQVFTEASASKLAA